MSKEEQAERLRDKILPRLARVSVSTFAKTVSIYDVAIAEAGVMGRFLSLEIAGFQTSRYGDLGGSE